MLNHVFVNFQTDELNYASRELIVYRLSSSLLISSLTVSSLMILVWILFSKNFQFLFFYDLKCQSPKRRPWHSSQQMNEVTDTWRRHVTSSFEYFKNTRRVVWVKRFMWYVINFSLIFRNMIHSKWPIPIQRQLFYFWLPALKPLFTA